MVVNKNMDLKQIRRDLKKIGFNYRLKKYSEFDYIEIYHIETKKLYPSIFTEEGRDFWREVIQYEEGTINGL